MMRSDLTRGTCTAGVAAAIAYATARWGFHRLYYLGVLLPGLAFLSLLVAWFLRLRGDGFFLPPKRHGDPAAGRRASALLLVSAVELALLATALYVFAGIGAHYY